MLSPVGRVAARRIATVRVPSIASQLLSHRLPAVSNPSIAARAFAVSADARLPAFEETKINLNPKTVPKLSPEEQQKLKAEEREKQKARELKDWALVGVKRPSKLPENAWSVYLASEMRPSSGETPQAAMAQFAEKWKNVSSAVLEEYEKTARSNRVTNEANLKAWIESYPVERIYLANLARRRVVRRNGKSFRLIRDDRLPKQPINPYSYFIQSRFPEINSNDTPRDKVKILADEWRNLSEAEKNTYRDAVKDEPAKYTAQMEKIKADAKALQQAHTAKKRAEKAEKKAAVDARKALKAEKRTTKAKADAAKAAEKKAQQKAVKAAEKALKDAKNKAKGAAKKTTKKKTTKKTIK